MKTVVICPGGATTGGVELLHQLVDRLVYFGCDAYICYYPFGKNYVQPDAYRKYQSKLISPIAIDLQRDMIILPEVYTYLAYRFLPDRTYIWWMSVDNYINSGSIFYALRNRFLPWHYIKINSREIKDKFAGHLCQSEYARLYLSNHNIDNLHLLSDYINDDYVQRSSSIYISRKKPIVVYNPTKGIEQTKKILSHLSGIDVIPIINMTRDQVMDLLSNAMVYIDFGNHPGKDRIPREAAMLGCCVITNLRGSAANSIDIPIHPRYKFDDAQSGFERNVVDLIYKITNDFTSHYKTFNSYRDIISCEKDVFERSVQSFLTFTRK